jgi:hypothetical protein
MSAADDLRALTAAATPGPWAPWGDLGPYVHIWTADERIVARDTPAPDAEFIAWCRNHAGALADLADTVKAIPRHYPYGGPEVEDVTGKCLVCGTSWPCPTERAHRALDALEANRG